MPTTQTTHTMPSQHPSRYCHRIRLTLAASLLSLLAACGGSSGDGTPEPAKPSAIQVSNFRDGETIRYSLPIINGRVNADVKSITINTAEKAYVTDVLDGNFKAPIPLRNGANDINFSAGGHSSRLRINYLAADNPRKVRMMYAIAADDDGSFVAEAGMPNTMEDARKRIVLQALLMQSATAEMLYKATKQRITYALLEDGNGKPTVTTLRLPLTRAQLYAKTDNEIYAVIAKSLRDANMYDKVKSMIIMGFSSYKDENFLAHAALGSDNLGIFGGLHLYACPDSLDQLAASFANTKIIDRKFLPDDSGGRETYWAQCATGMGASLHELGHTFGLDHTPTGIMSRGFDDFNRLFTLREPGFAPLLTTQNEGGAIWDPASIPVLLQSEWLKR